MNSLIKFVAYAVCSFFTLSSFLFSFEIDFLKQPDTFIFDNSYDLLEAFNGIASSDYLNETYEDDEGLLRNDYRFMVICSSFRVFDFDINSIEDALDIDSEYFLWFLGKNVSKEDEYFHEEIKVAFVNLADVSFLARSQIVEAADGFVASIDLYDFSHIFKQVMTNIYITKKRAAYQVEIFQLALIKGSSVDKLEKLHLTKLFYTSVENKFNHMLDVLEDM
ncbi:MAG: hypothetical protein ABIA04_13290 [Pseudomonadota bacterium]